jgi:CRP/FNR family transcriptional regulator, cyclic AMP receptor protein
MAQRLGHLTQPVDACEPRCLVKWLESQGGEFGAGIAPISAKFYSEEPIMSNCLSCPHVGRHAFCSLGEGARSFLESNSITIEYQRGNILFREGDACNAIFVICSGRVKVSATSREGRTLILRIAEAGDLLGMSAALSRDDYEVTAEAMEPCRLRVLQTRHLVLMLQQFGDAGVGAAKALAKDYRASVEEMQMIAMPGSPAGRLARLILNWAADAKRKGSATFVTMPLTHEELAAMTATTRETVTRTLGRFRKEKLISTRGVALTVLQPAALEQLSAC